MDSNFDEKIMIREQERLAREGKRKKNKRILIISIVSVVVLLIAGGVGFWLWTKNAQEAQSQVKVEVGPGQAMVVAKVVSIYGNELTYQEGRAVGTVSSGKDDTSNDTTGDASQGQGGRGQSGERPSFGGFGGENGEMPSFGSGEMPNFNFGGDGESGQMPSFGNGEMPSFGDGEMPSFSGFGQGGGRGDRGDTTSASAETFVYDSVSYAFTGATVTTTIPVGTVVTTKLGAEATFSRLAAGDYVALVIEVVDGQEVIVAAYIIG